MLQFLEKKNVVRVAAGAYHTLFLTDFGELYSTGLNANGQLGHGDTADRLVFTLVSRSALGRPGSAWWRAAIATTRW